MQFFSYTIGGIDIQTECTKYVKQHGKLSQGDVFCSKAGKLQCKMVAHAVGPIWNGGSKNEEDDLYNCVLKCLEHTDKGSYTSIAIPAISTGIYGYPKDKATKVIVSAINDYINTSPRSQIRKIYLCDVSDDTVKCFIAGMKKIFGRDNVKQLVDPEATVTPWKKQTDHKPGMVSLYSVFPSIRLCNVYLPYQYCLMGDMGKFLIFHQCIIS